MNNKYQEALDKVNYPGDKANGKKWLLEKEEPETYVTLKELVDRATPKKTIKLEIIDLDKIIMPEYTNTIDKYMCDNCGLTWFIVDGHTYQHKYCKQCGQALDWSNDE